MTTPILQPSKVGKADRSLELATARLGAVPVTFEQVWNPETCPAALLPWLGWGLSIDVWEADWSEATKRRMIAEAVARQRRKGSVKAVREVLEAFDANLELIEWFDLPDQLPPYTFEVRLPVEGGETILASFIEKVADQVGRVKPARAHFGVAQTLQADADVGVVAYARAAVSRRELVSQAAEVSWATNILTDAGEPLFTEDDEPLIEE